MRGTGWDPRGFLPVQGPMGHGPSFTVFTCIMNHASTQESRPGSFYCDHSVQFIFSLTYHSKITVLTKIYSISSTSLNFLLIKFQWRTYSYDLELNQTFWALQLLNKSTNSLVVSLFFFPLLGAHSHRIFFLQFITSHWETEYIFVSFSHINTLS